MARVIIKIGDIFSVKIGENNKKFFQLIAYDSTQLNSDVIRAFKKIYAISDHPDMQEIVNDEVEFYAHCFTKLGVKLGYWEKVGKSASIGQTKHILFRDTNDYGHKLGEEPVKISHKWYIWRINENFHRVGELKGENKKAEIGVVVSPPNIIDRMKTGTYKFVYPGFE